MKRHTIMNLGILFVLVSLLAAAPPTHAEGVDRDYNNVVIVLDASGSMNGILHGSGMKKMDAAKAALCEVLKQVPMDTHIGLLVFSGSTRHTEWVYPLSVRDDAKLMEAIDKPQAGGGTPLGAYIKKGADRLLEQRAKQHGYGTYRLLIVTDGEARDRILVDRHVPEVISRGITIDVIGVDMTSNHTLATKVHSYRRADDPASLKKAIAEVFAEVADTRSDTAGEDAFDQLAPIPDGMAAAMLKALSTSGNQPIGQVQHSTQKDAKKSAAPRTSSGGSIFPFGFIIIAIIAGLSILYRFKRGRR